MRPLLFLPLLAALLVARSARATPDYPAAIQTDLNLSYTPDCSLCHANGQTGAGTVTTPFGTSMRARGLVAGDTASLSQALMQMQTDHVDSDGDGVTDIDELIAGTNPNGAGSGQGPVFGCGAAQIDAHGPRNGTVAFGLLAAAGVLLARRRRRRPA